MEACVGSNDDASIGPVADLVREGVLTRCRPSARHRADIRFALPIIRRLGELDIGRSIAVKEREIIAVETLEGTEAMVRRAGDLCGSGRWVLMKIGGSHGDGHGDAVVVDPATIEWMKESGASCLAVAVGQARVVEKAATIAAADQARISIVGIATQVVAVSQ